jgi:hypothetical protein
VSPVKYELVFYILEDGILHSHCRENRKSYKIYGCIRKEMALIVRYGHNGNKTFIRRGLTYHAASSVRIEKSSSEE